MDFSAVINACDVKAEIIRKCRSGKTQKIVQVILLRARVMELSIRIDYITEFYFAIT